MSELNIQQELFCQYYVKNKELRGNATLSYALAYGHELESLSDDDGIVEFVDGTTMTQHDLKELEFKGEITNQKYRIIQESSQKRAYDVCSVNGSRLLRNAKVNDRIKELYRELLTNDNVDSVLSEIIQKGYKDSDRVAAIKEYNALQARIIKKIDHTTLGKSINPLANLSDEELRAIANGTNGQTNTSTTGTTE